jgi:hypothetical protein
MPLAGIYAIMEKWQMGKSFDSKPIDDVYIRDTFL